jgi:hypothetical protein
VDCLGADGVDLAGLRGPNGPIEPPMTLVIENSLGLTINIVAVLWLFNSHRQSSGLK